MMYRTEIIEQFYSISGNWTFDVIEKDNWKYDVLKRGNWTFDEIEQG